MSQKQVITERVFLREITEADTSYIVGWRSKPEVYMYFCSPHKITEAEHLNWFHERYLKDDNQVSFLAYEKMTDVPIGVFGIRRDANDLEKVEVSYLLDECAQEKGYAREAVLGLIGYARKQWKASHFMAEIHKDNSASIRMIEHLLFSKINTKNEFVIYERRI